MVNFSTYFVLWHFSESRDRPLLRESLQLLSTENVCGCKYLLCRTSLNSQLWNQCSASAGGCWAFGCLDPLAGKFWRLLLACFCMCCLWIFVSVLMLRYCNIVRLFLILAVVVLAVVELGLQGCSFICMCMLLYVRVEGGMRHAINFLAFCLLDHFRVISTCFQKKRANS